MEEKREQMSPEMRALVDKIESDMESDRAEGYDEVAVQARELKRRGRSVSQISKQVNRSKLQVMGMVNGVERDRDVKALRRRNRKG